jgi:hypothetical protein
MQADIAAALGLGLNALGVSAGEAPASFGLLPVAIPTISVETIETGAGAAAQLGDRVTLHFIVRTLEGKELANSWKRGMAFTVELTDPESFWHMAIQGLRAGGKSKLTANSSLFFSKGAGPIVPPDTMIEAELSVVRLQRALVAKKEPKG